MKKDTRVTIQCPSFRRGKKFEGIITGEKTLAALHIAKHGRTYFVKLDGNNKSTQFHESWLAELPAPSTPVKETEPAPTPTSKEGLEDSEIRVYGIDSNLHDGKIFDLTNNDFVHIAEGQGYVWTLAGFESAFNSEEIAYDMFIRFINPVKEQL
jgi:hypothetical protein